MKGSASRTDRYKSLDFIDHVLLRPDMYIGPLTPREQTVWVLNPRTKRISVQEATLKVSPGLIQIFNEILANAVDRQYRTEPGQQKLTRIDVNIDAEAGEITVQNDGAAIPVEVKPETGLYVPTMVFGEQMSGDNFDDDSIRFTGGRNGIGAKATNVFSKEFEVQVVDTHSKRRFTQVWDDNMRNRHPHEIAKLEPDVNRDLVKVRFKPDLERFDLKALTSNHVRIFKTRALEAAACTHKGVTVSFNGEDIEVRDFSAYAEMLLGNAGKNEVITEEIKDSRGVVRAEIAVSFETKGSFKAFGFVNGLQVHDGTHVTKVTNEIVAGIQKLAPADIDLSPAQIKSNLRVAVKGLIDNPDFDSQTKQRLTTPSAKFGFGMVLKPAFIKKIANLGILEAAIEAYKASAEKSYKQAMVKSTSKMSLSVAKLDDALNAGKKNSMCTLIVTEGDSAKALAVAGVSKVGRADYGIFPLKGKLLNMRTATSKQMETNEEIKSLVKIIGLEWGRTYQSVEELEGLRYKRVMIFSDQDLDGHHIAGLIINFFQDGWPSLLKLDQQFIQRFATPIVKVFKGKQLMHEFFNQGSFNNWKDSPENDGWESRHRVKYYKGLGTSTREEAVSYFADMDKHVMTLERQSEEDVELVERAFRPDKADERKQWLNSYDPTVELDYSRSSASFVDFFNMQFVHFSMYDNVRSIPLLMDGFKPSQRKVIHIVRGLSKEQRVSQLVGLVSSRTNYHHGENALVQTVVHLAQDFVGTNNINLLVPTGMFGSRLAGRSEYASARYIHTEISSIASTIFRKEDDDIAPSKYEEGMQVEPQFMLPVVPMALFNGFQGIGTGYMTVCPNYNPEEVAAALESIIRGEQVEPINVWYDGFSGEFVRRGGKLFSRGAWKVFSSRDDGELDTVEITELPVEVWTDSYIQDMEKKAAESTSMTVHKCADHNDQHVHLFVTFSPTELKTIQGKVGIEQFLKLEKPMRESITLFHQAPGEGKPTLRTYESPMAVLRDFFEARLPFYTKRRERLLEKLRYNVVLKSNQARYILGVSDGSLQLNGTIAEMEQLLETRDFERLPNKFDPSVIQEQEAVGEEQDEANRDINKNYDYLLNMQFKMMAAENADKLQAQLENLKGELQKLEGATAEDLWLSDIEDFKIEYSRWKAQKREKWDVAPLAFSTDDMKIAEKASKKNAAKAKAKASKASGSKGGLSPASLESLTVAKLMEVASIKGSMQSRQKKPS